jgi:hypothetical protein
MRLVPFVSAAPFAAALLFLTSSAHADGAFLSMRSATGAAIGARVPLATFNTSTATPTGLQSTPGSGAGGGQPVYALSFEIDGALNAAEYYGQLSVGTLTTLFVELTTADAKGVEQVTSTATFTTAMIKTMGLTFGPSGFQQAYTINYTAVNYGAPGGVVTPTFKRPTTLPVVLRNPLRIAQMTRLVPVTAPSIDGATLTLTGGLFSQGAAVPNVGPVPLKTATISFTELLSPTSGQSAAGAGPSKVTRDPILVTQEHGGTAAFQQSVATTKPWSTGTIAFTHATPSGATTVLNVGLQNTAVRSEGVGITGGVTTETTSFEDVATTITKP